MSRQSIEEKIGQLFIIGFDGAELSKNAPVLDDIVKRNLGGVILFDKLLARNQSTNNIVSPSQTEALTSSLQDLTDGNLLIAVDQEGGMVNRLKEQHGFAVTKSAETLGSKKDTKQTEQAAKQVARMLRSVGVNFNLAPVADLNSYKDNPIVGAYGRSFSEKPHTVFQHTAMWVDAHRQEGILSCLKHFPGHGSSRQDSHLGFVDISTTWDEQELQPYIDFINSGYEEAIMIGHLFNNSLDSVYPATLSDSVVNGLLRNQLQHKGVVISDDMQMRAITSRYGLADACCKAILAGIDLLIIGNNLSYEPDILAHVQAELLKAVADGRMTEERIEEAWGRVQNFKRLTTTSRLSG